MPVLLCLYLLCLYLLCQVPEELHEEDVEERMVAAGNRMGSVAEEEADEIPEIPEEVSVLASVLVSVLLSVLLSIIGGGRRDAARCE